MAFSRVLQIFLFIMYVQVSTAHAELFIDINKGQIDPLPVAITDFAGDNSANSDTGRKVSDVIRNNLTNSGLFAPISSSAFIQPVDDLIKNGPKFSEWKTINANALATGAVTSEGNGLVKVEFRLWDVFSEKEISGMVYSTEPSNWRRIAHLISDEIYKRITGEDGYFDTRIVYIAEDGDRGRRIKRLAIMDQDGANHQYLTNGEYLVLTPRFSPNSQKITYMSYRNDKPRVYIYNLDTGQQELLGNFPNMTFAPRFSPNGERVIMSLSQNGNSDIYTMDLRTRQVVRLTDHWGIDTSPSYAPDGQQVAFESDRGGTQQLYVMNSDGSNPQRITFGQGRYANPVWSPRGDLIAFTRIYKGKFYIGVIRPDGTGERLITSAYHVEGPSWAPNGRYLTYFKETPVGPNGSQRLTKLFAIDLTGYNERRLNTPNDGSDPAWSPLHN